MKEREGRSGRIGKRRERDGKRKNNESVKEGEKGGTKIYESRGGVGRMEGKENR